MTVKHIPPRSPTDERLQHAHRVIKNALEPYIKGRWKERHLEQATKDVVRDIKILLALPEAPEKGATVATQASSEGKVGAKNL